MTSRVELADRLSYCAGRDASYTRGAARHRPDRRRARAHGTNLLSLDSTTTMPLRVPGMEDEGRTPTSASANKAASANRQGQAIRQTKNQLNSDDFCRIAPNYYSPLLQRGGATCHGPALAHSTFWACKCARRLRDWPKGAPSLLIGPGGVAAATADRPSNRESNIVLRGLRSLADQRQPRSHPPDWARETPGPLELRPPRALWRQDGAKVLL